MEILYNYPQLTWRLDCNQMCCQQYVIFYISLIMLPFGVGNSLFSNSLSLEEQLFNYIDEHQDEFIQKLKEWVAVESDSQQPRLRAKVIEMVKIAADSLEDLGATVTLSEMGIQQLSDAQNIPLPPVVLANLGDDTQKPTVCFYGHVDVMPAKSQDGWKTHPFSLTEIDGNLYGRGATDNKGPVLAWINAVNAFKALNIDLPVNIKFLIEGMEEAGSTGLEKLVEKENERFFSSVDYILISDNTWLSKTKPALTYGARGNACFSVEVEGGEKDLHSGSAGGIIHEPMSDLVALLDSLVNSSGLILIPGIYDDVAPFTDEEKKQYELIEFDVEEHKSNLGVKEFLYDTKEKILSHMWRLPSLSIHGIEGAFYEPGIKTVIPSKVIGKFSIRQVPHMDLSKVEHQVKKHLEDVFSNRRSPNKLTVSMLMGAVPWIANINDPQYIAAKNAIRKVFNQDPDMIRDGSTIPIARVFQNITRKSVMMLPIGAMDDGEHSQKEKISRFNYINGTKMFASFLLEISKLQASNWKQ
ncbi:beta-Ala-His dipeptidase isoform X1 [Pantherophis guttatus]|uniref:Beta-Ala-His dipeptidase isoform X1 n=2 Tax=Pantherophis guttatus TaxID=94885 RepID=A0A6P9D0I7_PANGU|nr:beta-Ala-His dipeptidase isoform X1 [Pantherophis guttatus]XP_034285236.1 beta-Ala-His dipeptidase isoform X1 [Pantherophis guttatus]XP_034285237.1 beta-Ala-His dipeptidase isoform X1 [Pantherophis guttatus]